MENEKKMLEENRHHVFCYTRSNSELDGAGVFRKLILPFESIFSIKTYREVGRIITEKKIDIVHVHNTLTLISPSVYYAAFSHKIPVVQTVHNFRLVCPGATFFRDGHICEECLKKGLCSSLKHKCYRGSFSQTFVSVMILRIHRILGTYGRLNYICLTDFNKSKLLTIRQIKENHVYVKPNFTPSSSFASQGYSIKRKNQYVFVGRLEEIKGVDVLLRAWKNLGSDAPKLIMLGTGDLEDRCKAYIEKNAMTNVELRGFVPNDEVKKVMSESKALIFPTALYEGFPVAIAEAYSMRLPVITGDMGNAGSLVKDGLTGMLYKHGNAKALGEAVGRFEKEDMEKMAENAYKEYTDYYSEQINYDKLISIYHSVGTKSR